MENSIITIKERQEIFDNMVELLDKYDYDYTDMALYKIIDTWAEQKADLIALFKKHPNYVEGKFMIAFNSDWNREIDTNGARKFCCWIQDNMETIKANLPDHVREVQKREFQNFTLETFDQFVEAYPLTYFADFLYLHSSFYACQFLSESKANQLNKINPSFRFKEGQKMSRAINKLCIWLGIDKLPDYNKEFAKYADSVNPLKIVRHTIISINPIDYLTMSFGNSWASCHTIDKENRRDMPNSYEGQYSSGTISYMLDQVSMVFYTVSADYNGNNYFFEPKINRNMFHYGEDKLVQGRVYPQDNDSNADNIYKSIREIVQKVMADCLGIPNYWTTKKGTDAIKPYVWSRGTHYNDYYYYNNCCISFPKGDEINEEHITIGHDPICIKCGCTHEISDNINHCAENKCTCERCGCVIDDEDAIWINGEPYCDECAIFCDICEAYVLAEDANWIESEDRYVCDSCLDYYYSRCDHCDEYFRNEEMTEIASGDYVCEDCLERYYFCCDKCGEYYHRDDMFIDDNTGNEYCEDCWEEIHDNENEEDEEEEN